MMFSYSLQPNRRAMVAGLGYCALAPLAALAETPMVIAMGFYMPVLRDVPRKDVEVSFRFWLEELARDAKMSAAPVQFYDSLVEMKRDADTGKINFLVAPAMGLVQRFPVGDLADGMTGYKSVADDLLFVVRKDAGIRSPADLVGKRVALLDGDELTDIFLETLLLQASPKRDWGQLGSVIRESRGVKMVHRLFFSTADAALINRNGYEAALALNPQIAARVQVLDEYSFKCRSPSIGLFTARTSPLGREAFLKAALSANETARGRQVLQIYQTNMVERSWVQDLVPFRALLATHQTLKAAAALKASRQ